MLQKRIIDNTSGESFKSIHWEKLLQFLKRENGGGSARNKFNLKSISKVKKLRNYLLFKSKRRKKALVKFIDWTGNN